MGHTLGAPVVRTCVIRREAVAINEAGVGLQREDIKAVHFSLAFYYRPYAFTFNSHISNFTLENSDLGKLENIKVDMCIVQFFCFALYSVTNAF